MRKVVLTASLLLLSGCSTLKSKPEIAYQLLNVVDAKQTLQVARNPAEWRESTAAWAIGEHPSESSVLAYMTASAVCHAAVSHALRGKPKLLAVWQTVTIADKVVATTHNYSLGIRVSF